MRKAKSAAPRRQRKYDQQRQALIKKLVDGGLIKPARARVSCALQMVPKATFAVDGACRGVLDLRCVNCLVDGYHYPLPTGESLLAELTQGECFSEMDLSDYYWQF